MNKITSILAILFLGVMCVLWPFWLFNGYLDSWYLKIATFIAVYGGFVANLMWYLQYRKDNGNNI
jgi:drug/metabolite transporter (DMT)-like permease